MNTINAFHLDKQVWSEWASSGGAVPDARAFHSAVLAGDYVVIYGKNALLV